MTSDRASMLRDWHAGRTGLHPARSHHCPQCDRKTLPPAVQPSSYRLCPSCGLHFNPNHAVAKP